MGFSGEEYWSWLPCCPPGDLPNPGIEPTSLPHLRHWEVGSLPLAPPGKPILTPPIFPSICLINITGKFCWQSFQPRDISNVSTRGVYQTGDYNSTNQGSSLMLLFTALCLRQAYFLGQEGKKVWLKGIRSAIYEYEQGGEFRLKQPLTKLNFNILAYFPFYNIRVPGCQPNFPTESLLIKNI